MLRQGLLQGASAVTDEIEVTVDTELAITLRQVWSCQGHPGLRSELSSVTTDIDPDAFLMHRPPGPGSSPAACWPRPACHLER